MGIAKIVVVGLLYAVIVIYLQSINKEFALIAAICAGATIVMGIIDLLYDVYSLYEEIAQLGGINGETLKIIVKIVLICYIIEFATGIIEDFGLKSLADKVAIAGKIIILIIATPIIISLIDIIKSFIL